MQLLRYILFPFLFLLVSFSGYMATEENPWELKKNEKGIAVYSRSIAGSDFKEIKVKTSVKAPLSSIVSLLRDVPAFPNWVYKCETAHIVKQQDFKEVIYYQKSDVPWPVSDRDMVIQSKFRQDASTKIIYFSSVGVPEMAPEKPGVIRIRKFKGSWKLTPKQDGLVEIEYQVGVDPAGLIPAWLVNLGSVDGPFITTVNLKEVLKQTKYQSAKLSFVQEMK